MPDRSGRSVIPPAVPVPSPCVRNCCLDEDDICLGCFRSLEEIIAWGIIDNGQKHRILTLAAHRKQARGTHD